MQIDRSMPRLPIRSHGTPRCQWRHRERGHHPGGDTRIKYKNVAGFGKNTGQTTSEGGSCDETTAKKVITLQRAMTKKSRKFFFSKIG